MTWRARLFLSPGLLGETKHRTRHGRGFCRVRLGKIIARQYQFRQIPRGCTGWHHSFLWSRKISASKTKLADRPMLQKTIDAMRPGDVLVVEAIDRPWPPRQRSARFFKPRH